MDFTGKGKKRKDEYVAQVLVWDMAICVLRCVLIHAKELKIVTRIAWQRRWLEAQRQPKLCSSSQRIPNCSQAARTFCLTSLLSHGVISPNCQQVQSDSERARRHQAGLLGVQARVR